jgi:hypothetical protein
MMRYERIRLAEPARVSQVKNAFLKYPLIGAVEKRCRIEHSE